MKRSVLVLCLTLAAIGPIPSSADAKVPKDFVGVQDEYLLVETANYKTANLSAMSAIGVGTIRQSFLWRDIEATPGSLNFTVHDELVGKAAAHGVKILGVVFGPPADQMRPGSTKGTCPPKSNQAFGNFAAALAKRYGTNGTFWAENPQIPKVPVTTWQIWNEPNLGIYWCNKVSAKQYVALLKASRKALKAADSKAEIVTAGIPQSKLGVPMYKYINQMYAAGGKAAFDTLAIHPYSRTVPELDRRLRGVRQIMNRRGDRRAKIWVTELAWSDVGPGSPFRVGSKGQAKRVEAAFKLIGRRRASMKLRGAIYVFWRDLDPYPPAFKDFWGLHTGLLKRDGSFKPAYYAFKKAVSRLK